MLRFRVRWRVLRLAMVCVGMLATATTIATAQQTTWYFAEGATGPAFETDLLLVNPTSDAAQIKATFLRGDGAPVIVTFDLPPTTRKTLHLNTIEGLENAEVSTIVESLNAVPFVAERTMYWGGPTRRGGHNEAGIDRPRTEWYLAEGATGPFFHSYVLLANPGTQDATVTVQFFRDDAEVVTQTYTVLAHRRFTIDVNGVPGMSFGNFGARVTSSSPILVERAMYWSSFEGGTDVTAVPAPSTSWLFAEGTTLSEFKPYILLSNPNASSTTATVTFHLESGALVTKSFTIAGQSRLTVDVSAYPEMTKLSFGTSVSSALPIVAERAMYWGDFVDGAAVAGVPEPATRWGFAEGRTGMHDGIPFESYFLLLNPSPTPLAVHGTFYLEDGTGSVYDFVIPGHARYTLYAGLPPRLQGQDIAAFFEASSPFVAERATYWGWDRYGGHGSVGIPWQGPIATPLLGSRVAAPVFEVPSGTYNADFTSALISPTPGAIVRITRDGSEPTEASPVANGSVTVTESTTIRAKAFAADHTPSLTATAIYTMEAPLPVFERPSGQYAAPAQFVIAQPPLVNAFVRYTIDGSDPTSASPVYAGPIQAPHTQTLTIKAKTFRTGWTPSATATAAYDVSEGLLAPPAPTPAAGIYSAGQIVSLSSTQPFVTIRFTTDGSDPTASSALYSGPLTINQPTTLKARAFANGYSASPLLTARYDLKVATPAITPGDTIITGAGINATVTTSTPDAILRYTTDRNDPTEQSPQTFGPVTVSADDTLKVRAFKADWIPSDVAAATYASANIPISQGVFSVLGASPSGFNPASSNVTFQLTHAALDDGSVLVMRNDEVMERGASLAMSGMMSRGVAMAFATVGGLVDGRNDFEVYGTDSGGLEVYTHEVIWAGNRTATIQVTNAAGSPIAAAQVRLVLQADEAMVTGGITDGGGTFSQRYLPTNEPFTIEVSADGYRPATVTLDAGTARANVSLQRNNLDFDAGTQGWTGAVVAMAHAESSDPLERCNGWCGVDRGSPSHTLAGATPSTEPETRAGKVTPAGSSPCYPYCDNRQLLRTAAGSSSNTDILLQTQFEARRAATYTFKSAPGARKVRVRYRVQTAEIMPELPYYPGTLPIPDSYSIRLRSTTSNRSETDSGTVAQLYNARQLDNHQATPWRTIELMLDQDAEDVELRLEVVNAFDYAFNTGIWVDKIEEDVYSVPDFELYDYKTAAHTHAWLTPPKRLEALSAAPHIYYGGNTNVNGTLTIRGPVGSQVSSISLQILRPGDTMPIAEAPLVRELEPLLLRTIDASGAISVTASQFMFAINSGAFFNINPQIDRTLFAQVRVAFADGAQVTKRLGRALTVLTQYTNSNRSEGRDTSNCLDIWPLFPCGGDDWARPEAARFIAGVNGTTWNDFSNMNGGPFPKHLSHQGGLEVDGFFANYQRRDESTAQTMIGYLNQYGRKIARVHVTYRRNDETDPFWRGIKDVRLEDGRRARDVIRPVANHSTHFHWLLDPSRLP